MRHQYLTLLLPGLLSMGLLGACTAETSAPATPEAASTPATAAGSTAASSSSSSTDDYDYDYPDQGSAGAAASTPATGTAAVGGTVKVSRIADLKLETMVIKAGTTVQWTNADAPTIPHSIAGDRGEFDSKSAIGSSGFTFTFDKPGTIAYHCTIHPSMTGTITVS